MNRLEKQFLEKKNENGDLSYKSTGENLLDIFFMSSFFEKHLAEVKIGDSPKEKLFAMFMRDPRFGLGRRDLGRELLYQAKVSPREIVRVGRYDDLWQIPTDENLAYLYAVLTGKKDQDHIELAKKWMPRLTGKDGRVAKVLCSMWQLSEKEYRKLIKTEQTIEYKLSYAEEEKGTSLDRLFQKKTYTHPLVKTIDFTKVPSLAMLKYLSLFYRREDLRFRFLDYLDDVKNKKKTIHTTTANVYDAYRAVKKIDGEASDIIGKEIIDDATLDVSMNAIVILDTSASMGALGYDSLLDKAVSLAHALATHANYAQNQLITFSEDPRLVTIEGDTLEEQYESMVYDDWGRNTDFRKVMQLLQTLDTYPEYLIVLSDMEFDCGSSQSIKETMHIFQTYGAKTKLIWWNLNDRNQTVPQLDEYGNIYFSGYNLQILKLLENHFDMASYLNAILEDYRKKIAYQE